MTHLHTGNSEVSTCAVFLAADGMGRLPYVSFWFALPDVPLHPIEEESQFPLASF
jgi:hypothetical protein